MADRPILKAVVLLLIVLVGIPVALGVIWGKWQMHEQRECQKSRECREREAKAYRYVVDDEMRHAADFGEDGRR